MKQSFKINKFSDKSRQKGKEHRGKVKGRIKKQMTKRKKNCMPWIKDPQTKEKFKH